MPETLFYNNALLKSATPAIESRGIIITEVINKKQLNEFINFPYRLYKGNKYYVPQLKKDIEDTLSKNKILHLSFAMRNIGLLIKRIK